MSKFFCLDDRYSTTRRLTKDKPKFEKVSNGVLSSKFFGSVSEKGGVTGGLRVKGCFKQPYRGKPLISIVTVVYNGEKYLEQTIKSVLNQDYDNVEYIIVDGGSTDKTLDIIKKYDHAIDSWVSEKDSGIYNAMNKGVSLCTGDYVAFLNADDWYVDGIIHNVFLAVKGNDIDYVFGNVNILGGVNESRVFYPQLSEYKFKMPLPHPSLFIRKKFLTKFEFNESYKAIADYDFILKIIRMDLNSKYMDRVFVNFRAGGMSSTPHEVEQFRLAYEHFGLLVALNKWYAKKNLRYQDILKKGFKKIVRTFWP
ncbi:MAG: glycosyltransferase [Cycloclasticus sp.]|nr:glycosyltransferase [Cycloclasticus sp.]